MTVPFFDSNILIYAYSADAKAETADSLLSEPYAIGVQTLNELVYVARRKLKMSWSAIEQAVDDIEALASIVIPTELSDLRYGMKIAEQYRLATFDALMLAIALRAGSTVFYSEDMHEDMHNGLVIDNQLTITNPFI